MITEVIDILNAKYAPIFLPYFEDRGAEKGDCILFIHKGARYYGYVNHVIPGKRKLLYVKAGEDITSVWRDEAKVLVLDPVI